MDNRNINQQFPNRMDNEAKDISAIRETAERISTWLHYDLKKIIAPLQVLPKIPELLSEFQKKVVNQFSELFKNQIETLVVTRQANIRVLDKKISMIESFIHNKKNQLEEARIRIIDRYRGIRLKLVKEHDNFLSGIDNHVYDLLEKIYPKQIQEKFSYISIPVQNYIITHMKEAAVVRHNLTKAEFGKTKNAIDSFLNKRKNFYNILESYTCNLEPGLYGLPYYYVEVEEIDTKRKRTEIYFSFEFNDRKNQIDEKFLISLRETAKKLKPQISSNYLKLQQVADNLRRISKIPFKEIDRFTGDCKDYNFTTEVEND